MTPFAVINNGIVENCIEAETLEIAEEVTGQTCVEYTLEQQIVPGLGYSNGAFVYPEGQSPEEIAERLEYQQALLTGQEPE